MHRTKVIISRFRDRLLCANLLCILGAKLYTALGD
ncbi:unnamed protein product [Coffea canephora]|uniref:Uncharacterized protein n=1 Tax=Coffea canephora TaxID=49390 RepID=A0A068TQ23_COFCA|nr:unnamed protein product [Coffea canephora]